MDAIPLRIIMIPPKVGSDLEFTADELDSLQVG